MYSVGDKVGGNSRLIDDGYISGISYVCEKNYTP